MVKVKALKDKFILQFIKGYFNIIGEYNNIVNKGKPGKEKGMNEDVKALFKEKNVRQWQVAEALGMHESSLSRTLRKEVDLETKLKIFDAVNKLHNEDS